MLNEIFKKSQIDFTPSSVQKLEQSLEYLRATRYRRSSLELHIKYCASKFNNCISISNTGKEITSIQLEILGLRNKIGKLKEEEEEAKQKLAEEILNIQAENLYIEPVIDLGNQFFDYMASFIKDELRNLTENQQNEIKNIFSNCLNLNDYSSENKQITLEYLQENKDSLIIKILTDNDFKLPIEVRCGAPLGAYEYIHKLNYIYLSDYLVDHFNFRIINNNGAEYRGLWNGSTYLTDDKLVFTYINTYISKLEYNNKSSREFRQKHSQNPLIQFLDSTEYKKYNIASNEYIACKNCVALVSKKDSSIKRLEPSPDLITVYQVDANYIDNFDYSDNNPNYKKIMNYLNVLADGKEYILRRLLECLAYALIRGQIAKIWIYFYGLSDTGKTHIVTHFLKPLFSDYFCNIPLHMLTTEKSRFNIAELRSKLILYCDEVQGDGKQFQLSDVIDQLKRIVGNDVLDGEKKSVQTHVQVSSDASIYVVSNNFLDFTQDPEAERKTVLVPFIRDLKKYNAQMLEIDPHYDINTLYPDMREQSLKDALFMILLREVANLFSNFREHGYYITPSEEINQIHREFKQTQIKGYNLVHTWYANNNPMREYPLGQLISKENKEHTQISYYRNKFFNWLDEQEGLKRNDVKDNAFNRAFRDEIKEQYFEKKCNISGVISGGFLILPKSYHHKTISNYDDYKRAIEEEHEAQITIQRENTKAIREATEKHMKDLGILP